MLTVIFRTPNRRMIRVITSRISLTDRRISLHCGNRVRSVVNNNYNNNHQHQNIIRGCHQGGHCYSTTSTRGNKVKDSARDALRKNLFPGATVAVGGFGLGGIPETLIREMSLDNNASDLTVVSLTAGVDGFGIGQIIEANKVKRLIASYVGENKVNNIPIDTSFNLNFHQSIHSFFVGFFSYFLRI